MLALAFRAKAELGHLGVALVLVAGTVPMIVGAPWGGLLVDRVRTRPIVLVSLALQASVCLALASVRGWVDLALIATLAAAGVATGPAWSALVAELVGADGLTGAMGLLQTAQILASIAGPVLGGLAVASLGTTWPFVVDAASFVLLSVVVLVLRLDRRPVEAGSPRVGGEAFAGIRLVGTNRGLRGVVAAFTAFIVAIGAINVVEIFLVTETLHASAAGYGLLGGCFGLGALTTAATAELQRAIVARVEFLLIGGCLGISAGMAVLGGASTLGFAALGAVLAGAGNGMVNVHGVVVILGRTPDAIRGRVMAAVQGIFGAASILGLLVGGLAATAFAPRSVILGAAAASVLATLVTLRPMLASAGTTSEAAQLDADVDGHRGADDGRGGLDEA